MSSAGTATSAQLSAGSRGRAPARSGTFPEGLEPATFGSAGSKILLDSHCQERPKNVQFPTLRIARRGYITDAVADTNADASAITAKETAACRSAPTVRIQYYISFTSL